MGPAGSRPLLSVWSPRGIGSVRSGCSAALLSEANLMLENLHPQMRKEEGHERISLNYSPRTGTLEPHSQSPVSYVTSQGHACLQARGMRSIKMAHRARTASPSEPLYLRWDCPGLPPPAHRCHRAFSDASRGETGGKGRGTERAGHEGGHGMRVWGPTAPRPRLTSLYQPTMSSKLPTNFRKVSCCENRVSALPGISFCCWKFRYLTSLSTATS